MAGKVDVKRLKKKNGPSASGELIEMFTTQIAAHARRKKIRVERTLPYHPTNLKQVVVYTDRMWLRGVHDSKIGFATFCR